MQTYSGIAIDKPQHGNFERKKIVCVLVCATVGEIVCVHECECVMGGEREETNKQKEATCHEYIFCVDLSKKEKQGLDKLYIASQWKIAFTTTTTSALFL